MILPVLFLAGMLLQAGCTSTKSLTTSSLQGSAWMLSYHIPRIGDRHFKIEFLKKGMLVNHHPNETTPENDTWHVEADTIHMSINDNYTLYEGRMVSNNQMKGTAKNKVDEVWEWVATRIR